MILFDILSLFTWLIVPIVIALVIVAATKKSSQSQQNNSIRDEMWWNYLRSFQATVKTKKERELINALLEGRTADQLYIQQPAAVQPEQPVVEPVVVEQLPEKQQPKPIDNTILLLYFGAFLLVASVGLFVSLSGLDGLSRTVIVAATAALLYGGGLWLYGSSKKLELAGISFVGTGMIIAPLVGVAWYNLIADKTNAGIIWLVTSVVCVGLYYYAYLRIKNDFISYLLIGSFVSSIESAVLSFDLPVYGYAWGLIIVGIALAVNNRRNTPAPQLQAASTTSAQLLVPLSILGSAVLLLNSGSFQLAVTLLLSAGYYALLALWNPNERTNYGMATQITAIAALPNIVYSLSHGIADAGLSLLIVAAMYTAGLMILSQKSIEAYAAVRVAGTVIVAGLLLCLGSAWLITAGLVLAAALSFVVWWRLVSSAALQIGCATLLVLPYVAGLYALQFGFTSWQQLGLATASVLILGCLALFCSRSATRQPDFIATSYWFTAAAVLLFAPAWLLSSSAILGVTIGVAASFALLWNRTQQTDWLVGSGMIVLIPLLHGVFTEGFGSIEFSVGVGAALAYNIALSLVTRQSMVRVMVVVCMLLAPLALGSGGLNIEWSHTGYTFGYLLVVASCVLARAIARGALLFSSKVPIGSYDSQASKSYIAGYIAAGCIALMISLTAENSQVLATVVLAVITVFVCLVARIERNLNLYGLLPLLAQAILISTVRPDIEDSSTVGILALTSSVLAIGMYYVVNNVSSLHKSARTISVYSAYIGPVLVITQQNDISLLLPASLACAGVLTYAHNRNGTQSTKEISLAIIVVSVHWALLLMGVSNIHIHTHLLGLFLATLAVWRYSLNDTRNGHSYVVSAVSVVTIPLAFASLASTNGGMYGLLLIAEQVGFMLLGVSLRQRFLIRWGLWVGLTAILFQLRDLGYAFMGLLAVIVIGVAVYRLQKHSSNNTSSND